MTIEWAADHVSEFTAPHCFNRSGGGATSTVKLFHGDERTGWGEREREREIR